MSDIDRTRMIPLHIADQAVAACDAEIAKLREENARLKAEVERLTAFTTRTIIPNEELQAQNAMLKEEISEAAGHYNKIINDLEAQVERLKKFNDEAMAHIAKEERKSRERLEMAEAEVERLTKAGDAMAEELIQEYGREVCLKFGWFKGWNAAKEGKQP